MEPRQNPRIEPSWRVILLAVIAALGGSIVATLLQISHARGQELRNRRTEAADEFATVGFNVRMQFRDVERVENGHPVPAEVWKAVDEAVDALRGKRARVYLLFGESTPAGQAASNTAEHWKEARSELKKHRGEPVDDALRERLFKDHLGLHEQAKRELDLFTREAGLVIRGRNRFWFTRWRAWPT